MALLISKNDLAHAKRIVIKVGTSTLTHKTGKLDLKLIDKLACTLTNAVNRGKEVILVTSGAVGVGMGRLGMREKPKSIPEKQAAAAVGQGILLQMYEKMFGEYGQTVAQVLLTRGDIGDRKRYLNARNTLNTLLSMGIIPIINENDTVAWEEIRFGDNDTLAALVGGLIDADLLILMSDIAGLCDGNPKENKEAKLIPLIEEITPEIEALAGGAGTRWGSGGMLTKIHAAKIAGDSGIPMVIAQGENPAVLDEIMDGKDVGTLFVPKEYKLQHRKRWIAYGAELQGTLWVDKGAEEAIVALGKSLLPIGVVGFEGNFDPGATVSVQSADHKEFARGIVDYGSKDLGMIMGHKSREIETILGYKEYDYVIHRNNMVLKV
ncbi:glutamate 5-kinase [Candidatus Formimonas warabiya]|uniref:Glutamate 5-kinase n=1 Tax=Formimonas warabiya TaxID=1761012 RepID=A0A3G1L1M7_FORW1|nr:glutamate 5-kinase [Candidatus Formimonas warabiya]ATW28567.1 glutamate 5-kinase [Candidatus Formimonas warabiya]